MPALPPVTSPPVLRVEYLMGVNASIEAGSRFFLSYTGTGPNSTDLNTLATDIANAWNTSVAPVVYNGESLHGVEITDLSSASGATGQWTGTHLGTLGGSPLPANICAVVNHHISRRYRGGRPRTYFRCGTDGTMNGTNQWTAAFQTSILNAWQAWIAAILGTTGLSIGLANIVNVSYYSGYTSYQEPSGRYRDIPTLRPTPHVDTITSSSVAGKLGSQRRRLDV